MRAVHELDRRDQSRRVGARSLGSRRSSRAISSSDHAAHFFFPKDTWDELEREQRIAGHPVFPDRRGPAARRIDSDSDVADVIALFRLNYELVRARRKPGG